MNFTKSKKAFTLSEVLITLVIIGVVAALTIPTAISKYRKTVVANRLKSTYSTVSNMFKLAEAKYGSMNSWNMDSNYIISGNVNNVTDGFAERYMVPFLRAEKHERATYEDFGYTTDIFSSRGQTVNRKTDTFYGILLPNGVLMRVALNGFVENNKIYAHSVQMFVDINGLKGPNTYGKDIFGIQRPFDSNAPLIMYGEYGHEIATAPNNTHAVTVNLNTGRFTFNQSAKLSREQIMNNCKSAEENGLECSALIIMDGWKVADDYPWL